jgi:hypothetical protein
MSVQRKIREIREIKRGRIKRRVNIPDFADHRPAAFNPEISGDSAKEFEHTALA